VVFVLIAQTLNIICACGCGNQLEPTDRFGRPHKFIRGHNGSRRGQPGMFGKDNPNWKGGITINWSGYILSKLGIVNTLDSIGLSMKNIITAVYYHGVIYTSYQW
jgi:hypothetical protein